MIIDRARALAAFAAYVRPYDAKDPKVRLKIDHTYRVAALCERIARSLDLPEEEIDLAWLAGLLHDVGRFEQLRWFGTFDDSKSMDHAAASADVLFDQGHIRDYCADNARDARLQAAVALHSAYRLPEDQDAPTRRLCDILRDADKVDILRVNVETPMEDIYNVSTDALRRSAVTPEVVSAFFEHHAVLRSLKRCPADNAVGHASLVFELVYPESRRAVREQGYIWQLLDFETRNPDTARVFESLRAEMHGFLDQA